MITDKKKALRIIITWLSLSFAAAYLLCLLMPNSFGNLNRQVLDQLFVIRSQSTWFQPEYDKTIVHVDLNNTTTQKLNNFYLDRTYFAKAISNLAKMNVAAQMYDFVFAAPIDPDQDSQLFDAVKKAGNVYMGMSLLLLEKELNRTPDSVQAGTEQYLESSNWDLTVDGNPDSLYRGGDPLITFAELAHGTRGLGFLSIKNDEDGIYRRVPLVVRYNNGFQPSFAFRVICDYLGVTQDQITIRPGCSLVLQDAQIPGQPSPKTIEIPIDKKGNLIVNYIGPWDRMNHYNFYDILQASKDRDEMELWQEELAGKIVVVSQVSTGMSDVGPIPVDAHYPLSGLHANVMHTILTESFIFEWTGWRMVIVEVLLLVVLALIAFRFSAPVFSGGTFVLAITYFGFSALLFLKANIVLDFLRPVMMMGISLVALQVVSAFENMKFFALMEKEKEVAERDLEIGRQIQAGFFPEELPKPDGWEIAAFFQPARQVAGDFYDVFELPQRKVIGIVIADVCDKGVGAALFMALFRSLVRAFSLSEDTVDKENDEKSLSKEEFLQKVVGQTNNYIADTHSSANMFATLFFGLLDIDSGTMHYINCGHEPPVVLSKNAEMLHLKATGPAAGTFPDLDYKVKDIRFEPGDIFFSYTDGITDAQNMNGDFYTKERALQMMSPCPSSAEVFINELKTDILEHIGQAKQFDDLTMLAFQRLEAP